MPKKLRAGLAGSDIENTGKKSTSKTKARDEFFVAALIDVLEIVQEPAPAIDHAQQPSTRVMILVMLTEMLCELADPCRQQGDLDLGRAGVFFTTAELCKDLGLSFRTKSHLSFLRTARVAASNL